MGKYIVKSTPNKVLVDQIVNTFRKVDALYKTQKDVDQSYSPTSTNAQSGFALDQAISEHNTSTDAHADIRESVEDIVEGFNAVAAEIEAVKKEAADMSVAILAETQSSIDAVKNDATNMVVAALSEAQNSIEEVRKESADMSVAVLVETQSSIDALLQRISALENRLASLGIAEEGNF